jgi:hypothetical protein
LEYEQTISLTKMKTTEEPKNNPEDIGAQKEMLGYDVQPNQKNEMAKRAVGTLGCLTRDETRKAHELPTWRLAT